MKRTTFPVFFIAAFVTCLIFVIACRKEDKSIVVRKEKLTGLVQIGPFTDASVSLYELTPSLAQTGRSFNTQIAGPAGSFGIDNVALTSQFVEMKANGYYFNEVTDSASTYHISIRAISDIKDLSAVNINMLTHLEDERIKYLVDKGSNFALAKDTAQREVLSIFGFSYNVIGKSEQLDISVNKEENAILLAVSLILQGNRNVRDLTELLSHISTYIRQDGKLNDETILQKLRSSTINLDLAKIRSNLENRYKEISISASIPDFEKYINIFLSYTGLAPNTETLSAENITASSATLKGRVRANDLNTIVTFEYGTSSSYGITTSASPGVVTGHTYSEVVAELSGLTPATTYHFRIKTVNSIGTVYGNDLTFTTPGNIPISITLAPTNISTEGATLHGAVNGNDLSTTVTFEYGTTEDYGSTVSPIPGQIAGNKVNSIVGVISGLKPGTLYHFRIKAVNLLGTTYGDNITFTTRGKIPTVLTQAATNISSEEASLHGTVNANDLSTTISFEYGESTNYGNTISVVQSPLSGNTNTSISTYITGLIPETLYHYRIKAANLLGTTYSDDLTFKSQPSPIHDNEGNKYIVVEIGGQVWMAENLRATRFNDNTPIPLVSDDTQWAGLTTPAYCWFNNDETKYKPDYGPLYNWYTLDTIYNGRKNVCPVGWHPPTVSEWRELIIYVGGEQAGGKLMETGTSHWPAPNSSATNETGFTALPGGYRSLYGTFYSIGVNAYFLTSSLVDTYTVYYIYCIDIEKTTKVQVLPFQYFHKEDGASVRCVRDK